MNAAAGDPNNKTITAAHAATRFIAWLLVLGPAPLPLHRPGAFAILADEADLLQIGSFQV
ncbi:hypothetical protein JCM30394_32200 [Deferrisoma palaeochoriense]